MSLLGERTEVKLVTSQCVLFAPQLQVAQGEMLARKGIVQGRLTAQTV